MGPRFVRKMTYTTFDLVKVLLLTVILLFLGYNGFSKLIFVQSPKSKVQINPNFTPCNAVMQCSICTNKENLKQQCQLEVKQAFSNASDKCKGYIKNLKDCQNKRHGPCRIEVENVEGCISAMTTNTLKKWTDIANGK